MKLKILHLYPQEMNLYGDCGNILTLKKRAKWRGIDVEIVSYEPGDKIPTDVNLIFGGGGQDSNQSLIEKDLQKIAPKLKSLIDKGIPTLVICGIYQLFGKFFETSDGKRIKGIEVFDLTTKASPKRLIGNIVIDSLEFGEIVGYENHSGLTKLGEGTATFGNVIIGNGNNGVDKTEGARYKNCIGTYLHGPILPKNPILADFLIEKALEISAGKEIKLKPLDDSVENAAHTSAIVRAKNTI